MNRYRFAFAALLALGLALVLQQAFGWPAEQSAADAAEADESYTPPNAAGWGRAGGLDFLELVRGDARPDERLPMVVLIHGLGDEPRQDWMDLVPDDVRARVILPRAPIRLSRGYSWFPFRIGQARNDRNFAQSLTASGQQLAAALRSVQARRPTRGGPIVSGFSQGGMLSFLLASRHPERWSFALPISGGLPDSLWPARAARGAAKLPIRALHGTRDEIVPIAPARELVARLRELGYDATLREFPGLGHSIDQVLRAQVIAELRTAVQRVSNP